jgi:uncharacterized membrane protein
VATEAHLKRHYDARREAAWIVAAFALVFLVLAVVSWNQGWRLVDLSWGLWAVLALPGLLLCIDLWLGPRGLGLAGNRLGALVLLGVIVAGNVVGLLLLIAALITMKTDDLGGGQLLLTAAFIWLANVIVFGVCYWELDCGGPVVRDHASSRPSPDLQFPQDQERGSRWTPRVWDYLYVSLTSASAFSPTDTMPFTLKAKLLVGLESTVSLVIVVLVTARAVNVLGS